MRKVNNDIIRNAKVAEEACKYLEHMLKLRQRIIRGDEHCISLKDFFGMYDRYANQKKTSSLESDIQKYRDELKRKYASYIVLSEDEIKRVLQYAKTAVLECTFENLKVQENEFMRIVLGKLEKSWETSNAPEKMAIAEDVRTFRRLFELGNEVGFERRFMGIIKWNISADFIISGYNYANICRIDRDGNDTTLYKESPVSPFIAKELCFGTLTFKDENDVPFEKCCLFREATPGADRFICLNNARIYHLSVFEDEKGRSTMVSFKEYLEENNLSFLYSDAYTHEEFLEFIDAHNRVINISSNEMNNIEKSAETAAQWWANSINNYYGLSNGDNSKLGSTISLLATYLKAISPNTEEEKVMRFKELLKANILKKLLAYEDDYTVKLQTDYGPYGILSDCISMVGINAMLPFKTEMTVSSKRVILKEPGRGEHILFDADEIDFAGGSAKPKL